MADFKKGDFVVRKLEFRHANGWDKADTICIVEYVGKESLQLVGDDTKYWTKAYFKPVNVQSLLDEATKPLHHQIELKDARIRVLEGEATHEARETFLKRIDDLEKQIEDLEHDRNYYKSRCGVMREKLDAIVRALQ